MNITNLSRNKNLIVTAVVALVLAISLTVWLDRDGKVADSTNSSQPLRSAVVYITEDGFSPSTLKVKRDTRVIWSNSDSEAHRIAANPYPSHSVLPALDSKQNIDTNGSYSFVFTKGGTFQYHDELHPETNGVITVE